MNKKFYVNHLSTRYRMVLSKFAIFDSYLQDVCSTNARSMKYYSDLLLGSLVGHDQGEAHPRWKHNIATLWTQKVLCDRTESCRLTTLQLIGRGSVRRCSQFLAKVHIISIPNVTLFGILLPNICTYVIVHTSSASIVVYVLLHFRIICCASMLHLDSWFRWFNQVIVWSMSNHWRKK